MFRISLFLLPIIMFLSFISTGFSYKKKSRELNNIAYEKCKNYLEFDISNISDLDSMHSKSFKKWLIEEGLWTELNEKKAIELML